MKDGYIIEDPDKYLENEIITNEDFIRIEDEIITFDKNLAAIAQSLWMEVYDCEVNENGTGHVLCEN